MIVIQSFFFKLQLANYNILFKPFLKVFFSTIQNFSLKSSKFLSFFVKFFKRSENHIMNGMVSTIDISNYWNTLPQVSTILTLTNNTSQYIDKSSKAGWQEKYYSSNHILWIFLIIYKCKENKNVFSL